MSSSVLENQTRPPFQDRDAAADLAHVWHPFQSPSQYAGKQFMLERGEGVHVYDAAGRRYLDAVSGLWNMNLGYSQESIVEAISLQLSRLPFANLTAASHRPAAALASALAARSPEDLDSVLYASGGAEAVETAIKLARHVQGMRGEVHRRKIVALRDSYHGTSFGALSATGIMADRWQFGALLPEFVHVKSPRGLPCTDATTAICIGHLQEMLAFEGAHTIAAILVEPVMGVAGMVPPPPGYLQGLRDICDTHGILLIFDEVSCGCGRTGEFFAADRFGVVPDMIVMSKGLSGGYFPLAAVMARRRDFDLCAGRADGAFMHGYTFGGAPAGCAAALAYLDALEQPGVGDGVAAKGVFFLDELKRALAGLDEVTQLQGVGLAVSARLADPAGGEGLSGPAAEVVMQARREGVILRTSYDGATFNFMPPFICTEAELQHVADVFASAVKGALAKR